MVLVTNWGGNAVIYGVLAATYSFFQLFGAPILGQLSDRVGRRRVLLLSQFGTLLSWGVFLIAFALPANTLLNVSNRWLGDFVITLPLLVLFVARAADGLTGGNVSVSNAYLADITTEDQRSRNFGRMAVSSNLGYIVGPALAGLLGATLLGELLPVMAAFVISAAALALIQFSLAEVAPAPITGKLEEHSACNLYGHEHKPGYKVSCAKHDGIAAILAMPKMAALMAINFLVMLGFSFSTWHFLFMRWAVWAGTSPISVFICGALAGDDCCAGSDPGARHENHERACADEPGRFVAGAGICRAVLAWNLGRLCRGRTNCAW